MATVPSPFNHVVTANVGYLDATTTQIAAYQEPTTTTVSYWLESEVNIPANTTNQSLNLATLLPSATAGVFLYLMENTNPPTGFSFSTTSAGTFLPINPGGYVSFRLGGGALPTVYLTNTNLTTSVNILIGVASN